MVASAATTFALWAAPATIDTLAVLGAPSAAFAYIDTPCTPAIDGTVIWDEGSAFECKNVGPGQYGWVPID